MSNDKNKDQSLIGGIILIVVGLIALFVTFFDVKIVWEELAKLWPMFIIIFGVSILPISKMLKSLFVIILLSASFLLYYSNVKEYEMISEDIQTSVSVTKDGDIQEFSEPYRNNITEVDVEINYGAGTLRLNPPVQEFVKAYNESDYIIQDFSVIYEEDKADIIFDVERSVSVNVNGNEFVKRNNFYLSLNENPVYDFEMNVGASNMNFDFSDYKVSNVEVNGGACDINMKLGDLHERTDVSLNTGVSDIKISIPENSGCRVECESVLSNKDFKGFIKKSGNVYETSNYSSANNIINIEFSGAMSDFEIYRY